MVAPKKPTTPKRAPGTTPRARENQLIAKAYDLVERRLDEGTASSQETTHLLKMGSTRNQVEIIKLRKETLLLEARSQDLERSGHSDELYQEVIDMMRIYQGKTDEED